MTLQQDLSSRISIIVDSAGAASLSPQEAFSGWQWEYLRSKFLAAGIAPDRIKIYPTTALAEAEASSDVLIGFGEEALRACTNRRSIDKWQLSPLTSLGGKKFIATFDMARVQKQYELGLFQGFAFRRAREMLSEDFKVAPERFHLNPGFEETLAILDVIRTKEEISCDIETGYGQINTVGFAWSDSDAIAINVLPDRLNDANYYELWRRIALVLESDSRKIFQNFIYDCSYFSAYGCRVQNISWDTMWGMKVLWPELKSNLGNVGRIYTKRPYWKDDGKITDEEGQKKDWGNVRDWTKHYTYNCRDTTGTLEASRAQKNDMSARGLLPFFGESVMPLTGPIMEMCANGIPLDVSVREKLHDEISSRVIMLTEEFKKEVGSDLNPRSSRQVQKYLTDKGVKLPRRFDKDAGESKETANAAAIMKLRLKYPEMRELELLQEIKALEKALSSYIDFDIAPGDTTIRFSLNGCGTKTLRMSGGKDPWGRGFNIQTIPREGGRVSIKSMMKAPEGWSFVEVDLRQAESRYVAYAAADKKLIDMLESGEDVHKFVAYEILKGLGRPPNEYSKKWRDLGKKTGHGANYLMKEGTFVENVFKDMGMILTKGEAKIILESYFGGFDRIRPWHVQTKQELYLKRKLIAPSGWERYFYGRFGDDMLREAVAWAPQHTIPWVTNKLLLYLWEWRKSWKGELKFLPQVHDALYFLVRDSGLDDLIKVCSSVEPWHPEINLSGGRLIIPTEVKFGKCLAQMKEAI